ncbi:MAG: hypothetical protein IKO64_05535 [Kiritimatiellae bacterium]|nr:hypothetical protein [Kiritimatiellia bacterium]
MLEYAYSGTIPPKADRVGYMAFLAAQPVIDANKHNTERAKKASTKRWKEDAQALPDGDAQALQNDDAQASQIDDAQALQNDDAQAGIYIKGKGKEKEKLQKEVAVGVELSLFLEQAKLAGVPDEFARHLHHELEEFGWQDRDGKPVGNWRRYLKAAWTAEQSGTRSGSGATAQEPPAMAMTEESFE